MTIIIIISVTGENSGGRIAFTEKHLTLLFIFVWKSICREMHLSHIYNLILAEDIKKDKQTGGLFFFYRYYNENKMISYFGFQFPDNESPVTWASP